MKNVFSPTEQIENLDAKVIACIERLATLFKSNLQDVAKQYKLTPLQAQLLIFIAEHPPKLCSVTMLAKEFSVSKPTASDSLKTLVNKKYIEKLDNIDDARAFSFAIVNSAMPMVNKLTEFGLKMSNSLSALNENELPQIYDLNLKMLNIFSQSGLISCRMCYSCQYYQQSGEGFYCHLMKKELPAEALRLDCPEHLKIS
jgi:DNA-binding MarR family transcriptional regulator